MNFDQITLSNGLRIIGERIPHFRSVSWGCGSARVLSMKFRWRRA